MGEDNKVVLSKGFAESKRIDIPKNASKLKLVVSFPALKAKSFFSIAFDNNRGTVCSFLIHEKRQPGTKEEFEYNNLNDGSHITNYDVFYVKNGSVLNRNESITIDYEFE